MVHSEEFERSGTLVRILCRSGPYDQQGDVWNGLGKGNVGGGRWGMTCGQADYIYVSNGIILSRS